jgi:hypothetical protein
MVAKHLGAKKMYNLRANAKHYATSGATAHPVAMLAAIAIAANTLLRTRNAIYKVRGLSATVRQSTTLSCCLPPLKSKTQMAILYGNCPLTFVCILKAHNF